MNRKFLLPIIGLLIIQSCKKETINLNTDPVSKIESQQDTYQKKFATILAKALKSEPLLREFIKEESIKQFDNDNDILFQMVKDANVGDGKTVHQKLVEYSSESVLNEIENNLPLLTIFVPTLPTFSPDKWNTANEIPLVANSSYTDGNIYAYDDSGNELKIKPNQIPGFPIIVVKENERVVVENSQSKSISNSTSDNNLKFQTSNFKFKFGSSAFDGIHKTTKKDVNRVTTASGIDQVNIDAYNTGDEWQRDYVYYGLTPTNTRGQFRNNFSEFINSFKFLTPDALGIIADQDDPKVNNVYATGKSAGNVSVNGQPAPQSMWTEGNFEFSITVLINAKNGIGSQLTKLISVKPSDLFDLQYDLVTQQDNHWVQYKVYKLNQIVPKEYNPNVELIPWDLENYGTAWKFIVYEVDNAQEVTQTFENTSTYAANFEISGMIEKVGFKFGASATTSSKNTYSVKTTLNSDFLGEAVLTFDQPVIINYVNGSYTTREITTGNLLSMSIEPKRIF